MKPLDSSYEDQGLPSTEWRSDGGRDKRYYRLSRAGSALLSQLLTDRRELTRIVEDLVAGV